MNCWLLYLLALTGCFGGRLRGGAAGELLRPVGVGEVDRDRSASAAQFSHQIVVCRLKSTRENPPQSTHVIYECLLATVYLQVAFVGRFLCVAFVLQHSRDAIEGVWAVLEPGEERGLGDDLPDCLILAALVVQRRLQQRLRSRQRH